MKSATLFLSAALLVACGSVDGGLFGSGATSGASSSGGHGGTSPSAVSSGNGGAPADAGSDATNDDGSGGAVAASSSSGFGGAPVGSAPYWAFGVQQKVPEASLVGWKLCFVDVYADNTVSQQQVLDACPGTNLMLACRPKGDATLTILAMGARGDVTFMFANGDNTSTHQANGVGWYRSGNNWGFAPGGDAVWKGPMDVMGIDPNSPGPDGDKRLSWLGNVGQMWVGYRCGYLFNGNTPGFDYNYERAVFAMP